MSNTYKSVNMDAPSGGSVTPPYVFGFTTGTWLVDGSDYSITITPLVHEKGTQVQISVYELVSGNYESIETYVSVSPTGTVTLKVGNDFRFNGKVIIIGE